MLRQDSHYLEFLSKLLFLLLSGLRNLEHDIGVDLIDSGGGSSPNPVDVSELALDFHGDVVSTV